VTYHDRTSNNNLLKRKQSSPIDSPNKKRKACFLLTPLRSKVVCNSV